MLMQILIRSHTLFSPTFLITEATADAAAATEEFCTPMQIVLVGLTFFLRPRFLSESVYRDAVHVDTAESANTNLDFAQNSWNFFGGGEPESLPGDSG